MIRKLSIDRLLILTISLTGLSLNFVAPQLLAQPTPPQEPPPPNNSQQKPNFPPQQTPPQNNGNSDRSPLEADVETLGQALSKFFLEQNYQTESQTSLTLTSTTSPDTKVTFISQNKIISVAPDKFRAELNFLAPDGSFAKKYVVVSNGATVWIYRPDLKQYSTTSYEQFNNSDQVLWLGISSFMGYPSPADIQELQQDRNLKKSVQKLAGKDYFVYESFNREGQYSLSMVVNPANQEMQEFRMTGKEQEMDILMQETIANRSKYQQVDRKVFEFVPPQGTTMIRDLKVEPF
jgi:outer membrane lipoprotein-sorting protein